MAKHWACFAYMQNRTSTNTNACYFFCRKNFVCCQCQPKSCKCSKTMPPGKYSLLLMQILTQFIVVLCWILSCLYSARAHYRTRLCRLSSILSQFTAHTIAQRFNITHMAAGQPFSIPTSSWTDLNLSSLFYAVQKCLFFQIYLWST